MPLGYFPASEDGTIKFYEVELDDSGQMKLDENGQPIIREAANPALAAAILIRLHSKGQLSTVQVTPDGSSAQFEFKGSTGSDGFVGEMIIAPIFDQITDRRDLTVQQQFALLRKVYGDDPLIAGLVMTYVSDSAATAIWNGEFVLGAENMQLPDEPVPTPAGGMQNVEASQGQGPLPPAGGTGGQVPGGTAVAGSPTGQAGGDSDGQGTSSDPEKTGGDPIVLFSGQLYHQVTDLEVAGLGLHFSFRRTYLNQTIYKGPLGYNWDHTYNLWLRETQEFLPDGTLENVVYRSTGSLREDRYVQDIVAPLGDLPSLESFPDAVFKGPPAFFDRLEKTGNRYVLEMPTGVRFEYGDNLLVERIVDLNGNAMTFRYDGLLLLEVTDPVGKRFLFEYDSLNRITSVYDATGDRRIRYYYGDNGDLEEVDLDFIDIVAGTDYRYSGPNLPFALQHNLVEMINPLGESVLECIYGTTPNALEYNRVVWQRSVEGEFKYEYDFVYESDVDPATDRVNVPFTATSVTYPNGHVIEHQFNRQGNVVKRQENVLSGTGTIETLVARYRYNEDGLLIEETRAEGGAVEYRYEREVFAELHDGDVDSATPRERLAFGNLLKIIERPRPGFGETRSIATDYTYTQVGNRIAAQRGPYYANLQLQELPGQSVGEVHHDFDARGNLIHVRYTDTTNADGQLTTLPSTSYELDELGRMVAIVTGPLKTKLSYFPDKLRSGFVRERIADANGAALRVEFDVDPLGRTIRMVDHLGSVSESEYTSFDAPRKALLPAVAEGGPRPELLLTYNKNRELVRSEESIFLDDGLEHPDKVLVSSYRYDRYGRLVEASVGSPQSPQLRSQRTAYEPSGRPRKQIDSLENTTLIEYDARMLVRKVTHGWDTPSASTSRMRYNRAGEVIETSDGRGFKTAIGRDAFGRVRRLTTPDGTQVEAEYDAAGRAIRRVLSGVHPETGATVRWSESATTYDSAGRMIDSRIHRFMPGGSEPDEILRTRYYYDSLGRAERIVDPMGSEWRYEYDNLGRLVHQFDPDGNELQTKHDDAARTVTMIAIERGTDTAGAPVSRSFRRVVQHDLRGLPVAEIDHLGNTLRRAFDSRGLVLKVTSPSGQTYISECDILGQVSRQLTVLGDRTLTRHFEHDANGNVIRITSPAGGTVDYEIDSLGRIVRTTRDNGLESRFSYDAEGNLVEYRSEDGIVIRRAFSGESKLLSEDVDSTQFTAPQELPTYNPSPTLPAEFRYTPSGSLAMARNEASTCIYRYDSIGRLLEEQSDARRMLFGYDVAGRRTSMTYPDGRKLIFGYRQSGSLARIDQTARGSAYPGDVSVPEERAIVQIDREGRRPTVMTFGSSHALRLRYDQRQQAIEMDWVKSSGGQIARLRYLHGSRSDLRVCQLEDRLRVFSYDALARLTGVKDYRQPNAIPLPEVSADQQQIDELIASVENQLASASPERTFAYILDANTNRLRTDERLTPGGPVQTTEYSPDPHDRYQSIGGSAIVHDRAGNMLDDGVNTYRLDAVGRLAETVTPEGRIRLTRDALGRVVRLSSPEGEYEFLYAGKRLVEWRKAGVVTGQVVPLERPNQIAHLATEGRDLSPLFDHMDSILAWVTPAGAIDSRAFYDPFGQILEQTPNWPAPFGYAGFLYEKFSRNYETLARTYSPRLGRFVQSDPMGYVDGMNLYAFAHHAPGSLTDYFGFSSNDIDWGIVGWEAGSTLLKGAGALLAGTALVVGGIVSLPAMLAAGGIALAFSLTVSVLHRGKEAIDAGVSDDDLFWKASVAGIGDQIGATDIYQGVTGTEVFSGETLGTKRRSELLGGGIGSLGGEAMGSFVAKPFAKLVDAKLPATKFSGKYWDSLSKPELAPELGPVAVGSSHIVVSRNALAMHIAAKRPVHITLGPNSLENLDDVTLMAHGIRSAGTDELSGALNVRLDGYGDVSPERLAEILYLDAGWSGGTLRLAACNTGNFNPQLNGIYGDLLARELARLGVPTAVIAPTGPVSALVQGSSFGLPRIRTTPKASPFYLQPGRGWEYFSY